MDSRSWIAILELLILFIMVDICCSHNIRRHRSPIDIRSHDPNYHHRIKEQKKKTYPKVCYFSPIQCLFTRDDDASTTTTTKMPEIENTSIRIESTSIRTESTHNLNVEHTSTVQSRNERGSFPEILSRPNYRPRPLFFNF